MRLVPARVRPARRGQGRRGSARRRDERGAAALEFALVYPLVLLVVLGIVQYGYHYWALSTASAAAREAARQAIVGTDWTCVEAQARDKASVPAVGDAPVVELSYVGDAPEVGETLEVTVSFDSLDIGILPLPDGGAVSQTASARVENIPAAPLPC